MAAVPRTKVLVVSYPRTGPQGRNQEANEDKILSGSAAARTDVYGSGAAERRSRPAMRDWQWWGLKSPSSHEASSASTARARSATIAGEPPSKGGILAALRRSPLVGADLNLARSREAGRKVDM